MEDGFALFGDPSDGGMSAETEQLAARVIRLLDKLPPIEADWVQLFFFDRWSQDTIAALFNVSQPTVCYRLRRAEQRLRFLLSIPDGVDADRVCEDVLEGYLGREQARAVYGVILHGAIEDESLAVDDAATAAERAARGH